MRGGGILSSAIRLSTPVAIFFGGRLRAANRDGETPRRPTCTESEAVGCHGCCSDRNVQSASCKIAAVQAPRQTPTGGLNHPMTGGLCGAIRPVSSRALRRFRIARRSAIRSAVAHELDNRLTPCTRAGSIAREILRSATAYHRPLYQGRMQRIWRLESRLNGSSRR